MAEICHFNNQKHENRCSQPRSKSFKYVGTQLILINILTMEFDFEITRLHSKKMLINNIANVHSVINSLLNLIMISELFRFTLQFITPCCEYLKYCIFKDQTHATVQFFLVINKYFPFIEKREPI